MDGMHRDVAARIDAVEAALGERLHLSGSLEAKLAGARGRLPRAALAQARELSTARAMLANPATARNLDAGRVVETCAMLERHLAAIPEGKYRRRARSGLIGLVALRLLIVFGLVLAVLAWRGLT
ncbi:hypothetical protein [Jannaschia seohaensis]|uniref:Uncharacterized protein n=1 Tax=Jannaschia seohaensis TaxID=475081 RepID=A0A2Y9A3G9_9RHOB|nr:hypothetical protein [Jannaschia seohaensis]PWJ22507.1 hypothetical protein BCF38_101921 [Jannaschia seohaensis]SSA38785.1 hypothetical protein SAMN05421539_101921 [Jannaschia seohaensis]